MIVQFLLCIKMRDTTPHHYLEISVSERFEKDDDQKDSKTVAIQGPQHFKIEALQRLYLLKIPFSMLLRHLWHCSDSRL